MEEEEVQEEHSIMNNNNNSNEIAQITSLSNARRLQIRRGILRQTTSLRASPYNSIFSNLRRRQTSLIASQTISNLISNIDNDSSQTNVNTLPIDQDNIEVFLPEAETIQDNFPITSNDETDNENFEVLVDFSNPSPIDLTITNENYTSSNEQNPSYHSLSTVDLDPDDYGDDYYVGDDDDDDHRFYYTSTSIPIIDYSPSTSTSSTGTTVEPLIIHNNPLDITQHRYYDEYLPSINNSSNNGEDLNIEIILENPQTNTSSIRQRRRRSIISSNIRNNRGLRLSDILSIPQKLYNSLKEQINDEYQQTAMINTQCYVCLEDFKSTDSIKILNCQHIFHSECINEWLRSHATCAYCRTPVFIDMLRPLSSPPPPPPPPPTTTTTGRRERTRTRRNHNTIQRTSTNNLLQPISIETSAFQQQES
ncbi:unnamed protein product [Rotaria magnacalcarata]|uniref:RING-type domain-containing protein n=1 Tax=Rotaria magnacalcarata TaxID=392030 RepID=A0A815FIR4_9BILA|nr:unnamed protein product [Rotaria magnacalcarata]CAF3789012.1 unnamed protein product [Rotaria magnacalcarata]